MMRDPESQTLRERERERESSKRRVLKGEWRKRNNKWFIVIELLSLLCYNGSYTTNNILLINIQTMKE